MIMGNSNLTKHHSQRHRQQAPSLTNHNSSLYSQISLKDSNSPQKAKPIGPPVIAPLVYAPSGYHNFSTSNQIPKKMMSVSNSRKSNENILAQLSGQQHHDGSLLNIP